MLLDAGSWYSMLRFIHCMSKAVLAACERIQKLETLFNSKVLHMTLMNRKVVKCARSEEVASTLALKFWIGSKGEVSTMKLTPPTRPCRMAMPKDSIVSF